MDEVRGSFYGQRPGAQIARFGLRSTLLVKAFTSCLTLAGHSGVVFMTWVALPGEYTPDVLSPLHPVSSLRHAEWSWLRVHGWQAVNSSPNVTDDIVDA
ncbi:hypothetical protein TNCV_3659151 [Trichonephila clavipes]|nr:hypothetical protein TNCV_3659151 [Trichonephila clavipes]